MKGKSSKSSSADKIYTSINLGPPVALYHVKRFKRALSLSSFTNHSLAICISQFTVVLIGSEKRMSWSRRVKGVVLRLVVVAAARLIYTRTATKH